jgi:hypothetical protein
MASNTKTVVAMVEFQQGFAKLPRRERGDERGGEVVSLECPCHLRPLYLYMGIEGSLDPPQSTRGGSQVGRGKSPLPPRLVPPFKGFPQGWMAGPFGGWCVWHIKARQHPLGTVWSLKKSEPTGGCSGT